MIDCIMTLTTTTAMLLPAERTMTTIMAAADCTTEPMTRWRMVSASGSTKKEGLRTKNDEEQEKDNDGTTIMMVADCTTKPTRK